MVVVVKTGEDHNHIISVVIYLSWGS